MGWLQRLFRPSPDSSVAGRESLTQKLVDPTEDADLQAAFQAGVRDYDAADYSQAARQFEAVIARRHDWALPYQRLGLCQMRQGQPEQARDSFVMALVFDPRSVEALYALALAERSLDQPVEALSTLDRLLLVAPGHADALNFRGALLLQRGDVAGAAESFRHAVDADPNHAAAHANLGYLYFRDFAEYELGTKHIEHALALDPANRNAQCNYTMVLSHRGLHEEALALCDRLLAESPGMQEARLNRALVLLKLRRFDTGWDDYESRKQVRCNYIPRTLPWPEWKGEDLSSKTILVHGEQGLGDEIMFASCIGDLIARARRVVIECSPRLRSLFERSFPAAIVHAGLQGVSSPGWMQNAPAIDCHVSSGSLPRHFRRRDADFPAHAGYLVADAERVRHWQERMTELGEGFKVGLSWRGGMQSTRRTLRSLDLSLLDPLLRIPGTRFVDLQYGDTSSERSALASRGIELASWPDAIADLDETAALICSLDLVITVCTTVVHLTGALGRPAWVLVPSVPEWRYQAEGSAMPWYPAVQLFRQGVDEGWEFVIERMAARLADRPGP